MSTAFGSIKAGLTEALAHAKGQPTAIREHRIDRVDVRQLRAQIGLTQEQFSSKFGISLPTLRHWERGDRSPQGPALLLLNLFDRDPKGVLRALS